MNIIYDYPKKTAYGKMMPKSKIYQYASPGTRVKELFVREVDKIIWSYKLSPQTLNLSASGFVKEIQVITIYSKSTDLNQDVLRTIDKAIPSPVIFVLMANNKTRYSAAYKRRNEADRSKWVVSEYFFSQWMKKDKQRQSLPIALNLKILYETLIKNFIPIAPISGESMEVFITRVEKIGMKKREAEKFQTKIRKTKQYNRKVELHTELGNLKKEIKALSR